MILLPSQKDEIFDIIESVQLSPNQFEISEQKSLTRFNTIATKLKFNNSNYFFSFETEGYSISTHYAIFCPGFSSFREEHPSKYWNIQLNYVKTWLNYLIREVNAPNKWERLNKEISGIGIKYDLDERKFTAYEFEEMKQRISILQGQISSLELPEDLIQTINRKLDDVLEFAKNANKFDWRSYFIGTITSIIIQLSLTQENAQAIWSFLKQTFNNLFLP